MATTTGSTKRRGRPPKASQSDSEASPATEVAQESKSLSQGCTECLTAVYDPPMATAQAIHNWLSSLSRGIPHAQR
ncbi:hypothetical protein G176_gp01 [Xanthomonas phage CP1]|uniref:Uncharacterized protein n=1 Tax=Xanthomonas phage CP1 TaxID=2994055 RepID=I7HBB1_9CAUD|nr:hypothetical protein G176_gp01 [Xanthomonas phage CP1]BAM29073.1 hypothetical protein [Xanthomonas phage CP1]